MSKAIMTPTLSPPSQPTHSPSSQGATTSSITVSNDSHHERDQRCPNSPYGSNPSETQTLLPTAPLFWGVQLRRQTSMNVKTPMSTPPQFSPVATDALQFPYPEDVFSSGSMSNGQCSPIERSMSSSEQAEIYQARIQEWREREKQTLVRKGRPLPGRKSGVLPGDVNSAIAILKSGKSLSSASGKSTPSQGSIEGGPLLLSPTSLSDDCVSQHELVSPAESGHDLLAPTSSCIQVSLLQHELTPSVSLFEIPPCLSVTSISPEPEPAAGQQPTAEVSPFSPNSGDVGLATTTHPKAASAVPVGLSLLLSPTTSASPPLSLLSPMDSPDNQVTPALLPAAHTESRHAVVKAFLSEPSISCSLVCPPASGADMVPTPSSISLGYEGPRSRSKSSRPMVSFKDFPVWSASVSDNIVTSASLAECTAGSAEKAADSLPWNANSKALPDSPTSTARRNQHLAKARAKSLTPSLTSPECVIKLLGDSLDEDIGSKVRRKSFTDESTHVERDSSSANKPMSKVRNRLKSIASGLGLMEARKAARLSMAEVGPWHGRSGDKRHSIDLPSSLEKFNIMRAASPKRRCSADVTAFDAHPTQSQSLSSASPDQKRLSQFSFDSDDSTTSGAFVKCTLNRHSIGSLDPVLVKKRAATTPPIGIASVHRRSYLPRLHSDGDIGLDSLDSFRGMREGVLSECTSPGATPITDASSATRRSLWWERSKVQHSQSMACTEPLTRIPASHSASDTTEQRKSMSAQKLWFVDLKFTRRFTGAQSEEESKDVCSPTSLASSHPNWSFGVLEESMEGDAEPHTLSPLASLSEDQPSNPPEEKCDPDALVPMVSGFWGVDSRHQSPSGSQNSSNSASCRSTSSQPCIARVHTNPSQQSLTRRKSSYEQCVGQWRQREQEDLARQSRRYTEPASARDVRLAKCESEVQMIACLDPRRLSDQDGMAPVKGSGAQGKQLGKQSRYSIASADLVTLGPHNPLVQARSRSFSVSTSPDVARYDLIRSSQLCINRSKSNTSITLDKPDEDVATNRSVSKVKARLRSLIGVASWVPRKSDMSSSPSRPQSANSASGDASKRYFSGWEHSSADSLHVTSHSVSSLPCSVAYKAKDRPSLPTSNSLSDYSSQGTSPDDTTSQQLAAYSQSAVTDSPKDSILLGTTRETRSHSHSEVSNPYEKPGTTSSGGAVTKSGSLENEVNVWQETRVRALSDAGFIANEGGHRHSHVSSGSTSLNLEGSSTPNTSAAGAASKKPKKSLIARAIHATLSTRADHMYPSSPSPKREDPPSQSVSPLPASKVTHVDDGCASSKSPDPPKRPPMPPPRAGASSKHKFRAVARTAIRLSKYAGYVDEVQECLSDESLDKEQDLSLVAPLKRHTKMSACSSHDTDYSSMSTLSSECQRRLSRRGTSSSLASYIDLSEVAKFMGDDNNSLAGDLEAMTMDMESNDSGHEDEEPFYLKLINDGDLIHVEKEDGTMGEIGC